MVINDLGRFIFIHIPKNAGNSITRLLLKHRDNSSYDDVPQHAALKWIGNNLPEKLLYRKICFSRNPYSRMVSWWTYNRSHEKFWKEYDLARHARDMEFNEWLLKCIQRGRQELIPQVYFISPNFKYKITIIASIYTISYKTFVIYCYIYTHYMHMWYIVNDIRYIIYNM